MTLDDALQFDPQGALRGELQKSAVGRFLARGLASATGAPSTRTRSSIAAAIYARFGGRYAIVGAIQSFSMQQARTVDDEFEVDANATGLPVDLVPQTLTSRTLVLQRYDLYTSLMEEAFGTREIMTLCDQVRGLAIREVWRDPTSLFAEARVYEYRGCFFTNLGRRMSASDNRIVSVDGTLTWKERIPLSP